jgi:hypothetical protein
MKIGSARWLELGESGPEGDSMGSEGEELD